MHVVNHLTGRPAEVAGAGVSASLPAAGLGPIRLEAAPAGPGETVVPAARFPAAGLWTLRLDIRGGEFDQSSAEITVPIRKDT